MKEFEGKTKRLKEDRLYLNGDIGVSLSKGKKEKGLSSLGIKLKNLDKFIMRYQGDSFIKRVLVCSGKSSFNRKGFMLVKKEVLIKEEGLDFDKLSISTLNLKKKESNIIYIRYGGVLTEKRYKLVMNKDLNLLGVFFVNEGRYINFASICEVLNYRDLDKRGWNGDSEGYLAKFFLGGLLRFLVLKLNLLSKVNQNN